MSSGATLLQNTGDHGKDEAVAVSATTDERTVDGKPLYIQVTILDPEVAEKDGEKFMVYPLSTDSNHKSITKKPTVVMRRYREFVWLRTHFKLDGKFKERKVPDLPPKSMFKSFSDKKFNEERLRGLETFINAICTDDSFLGENILYQFLKSPDLSKSVGYSV
jgi:hypothetical protein